MKKSGEIVSVALGAAYAVGLVVASITMWI